MSDIITSDAPFSQTWGMIGHEWAVDALRRSMLSGRTRQAYLFVGAEGIGKETLARSFAMTLQCLQTDLANRPCGECSACKRIMTGSYPDVFYSVRDTATLKIDEIRRVSGQIAMMPYEGRYRIAIFRDFDAAMGVGQDALLKTLEEPASTSVLILLARSLAPILATITSRSQVFRLRPVSIDTIRRALIDRGTDEKLAALAAALSGGRPGWAINALEDTALFDARSGALDLLEKLLKENRARRFLTAEDLAKDKDALRTLLELWLSYWRDLVLISENAGTPLTNIDRTAGLRALADTLTPELAFAALRATADMLKLLDTNASARHGLEIMFLDYPGLSRA